MPRHLGYKRRDARKLETRRFTAIARLHRGETPATVARSFGVSVQSVQRWARWHRAGGNDRLRRRPKIRGPQPKLPREKLKELRVLLERGPVANGFDTPVWTTERVALLIRRHFGVTYSRDHLKHTLLPRLEWKWHKHTWLPAGFLGRGRLPSRNSSR